PAHAELAGEPRTVEQRCAALAERQPVRRIGDRKDRGVAPEACAREERGAGRAQPADVVAELEEPTTRGAFEAIGERIRRAAIDTREVLRQGAGRDGLQTRSSTIASIASMRGRSVCWARAG